MNFDTKSELSYSSKGSSKFSMVTGASGMSRRSKRPKNLSKRKIKEGSLYEEEYLVECLNEEKLSDETKNDLRHLLDCLVLFGFENYAVEIIETIER